MNKNRNSNIELLRIIAMLMIICYHIYYHCIYSQLTDASSIEIWGNGFFSVPEFFKELLILSTISPLGKIGNVIFILISGYFMVSKGSEINLIKTSKKLLFQQLFAALVLTITSTITFHILSEEYIYLLNFNIFNGMSWFVGYYFIIIVIATVFLNNFLGRLDRNQYLTFLLVLFAITQFSWTNKIMNSLSSGFGTLCVGIFIYSLGGFLKKYNPFEKVRVYVFWLAIAFSFGLIYLSSYNITYVNIEKYIMNESTNAFIQKIPSYSDSSFICIVVGVSIFEIFSRLNIGSNKLINFIGSSTLMIYLLHDNQFAYTLWKTQDWITPLYESPATFMLMLLKWTLETFLVGFAAYLLFLLIGKVLIKCKKLAIKG